MNRYLIVPLVFFVCVFVTVLIVQNSKSDASAASSSESVISAITSVEPDGEVKLLGVTEAELLVRTRIDESDSSHRMLSRARIVHVPKVMTVQIESSLAPQSRFFLGSVTIENGDQHRIVPVAVDRVTQVVFMHSHSRWVEQKKWTSHLEFEPH